MFISQSIHTLDAKNRVFIPKRFQTGLKRDEDTGHRIAMVTRGFERCLFLFSEPEFGAVLGRMRTLAFEGTEERKMQRLFFGSTHRAPLDASGRLLLPEPLRKIAGIDKEVVLVGGGDRIEIWAKEVWEAYEEENSADYDNLDRVLLRPAGEPEEL